MIRWIIQKNIRCELRVEICLPISHFPDKTFEILQYRDLVHIPGILIRFHFDRLLSRRTKSDDEKSGSQDHGKTDGTYSDSVLCGFLHFHSSFLHALYSPSHSDPRFFMTFSRYSFHAT